MPLDGATVSAVIVVEEGKNCPQPPAVIRDARTKAVRMLAKNLCTEFIVSFRAGRGKIRDSLAPGRKVRPVPVRPFSGSWLRSNRRRERHGTPSLQTPGCRGWRPGAVGRTGPRCSRARLDRRAL